MRASLPIAFLLSGIISLGGTGCIGGAQTGGFGAGAEEGGAYGQGEGPGSVGSTGAGSSDPGDRPGGSNDYGIGLGGGKNDPRSSRQAGSYGSPESTRPAQGGSVRQ